MQPLMTMATTMATVTAMATATSTKRAMVRKRGRAWAQDDIEAVGGTVVSGVDFSCLHQLRKKAVLFNVLPAIFLSIVIM